jgi:hypothetical protein
VSFCNVLCGRMIWTKKVSLAKRVFYNNHPGNEANDGPRFSRSGCGGSPTRRPVFCRIASGRSYPRSLRRGKIVLARLGLHTRSDRMGLSFAMSQPRSFLPRCGGPVDRLASGARPSALFGRRGGLLHGAKRVVGSNPSSLGLHHQHQQNRHARSQQTKAFIRQTLVNEALISAMVDDRTKGQNYLLVTTFNAGTSRLICSVAGQMRKKRLRAVEMQGGVNYDRRHLPPGVSGQRLNGNGGPKRSGPALVMAGKSFWPAVLHQCLWQSFHRPHLEQRA